MIHWLEPVMLQTKEYFTLEKELRKILDGLYARWHVNPLGSYCPWWYWGFCLEALHSYPNFWYKQRYSAWI